MDSAVPEVLALLTDTTGVKDEDGANAPTVVAAIAAKRKATTFMVVSAKSEMMVWEVLGFPSLSFTVTYLRSQEIICPDGGHPSGRHLWSASQKASDHEKVRLAAHVEHSTLFHNYSSQTVSCSTFIRIFSSTRFYEFPREHFSRQLVP
jgi:hypothetical protein